ncbi:unnamed protein product [Acanthoscelides obtectus]|uniref:Nuclease HARBI1 n=1 Tax=Acanthoscelides obtectus TaxID=200917 RepID=A0A9P0JKI6_ACAOB|nr:unnamed protein product [Acanthoscelides obtectus]CAK1673005.1 Putative nuclease HARBI1 [Acanthoscelides obtectus]
MLKERIRDNIAPNTERNHALISMQQLLLVLRLCATGSMLQTIGDFGGIHKSTASQVVKKVIHSIVTLAPEYIKMPRTQQEMQSIENKFYNIARFPRLRNLKVLKRLKNLGLSEVPSILLVEDKQRINSYVWPPLAVLFNNSPVVLQYRAPASNYSFVDKIYTTPSLDTYRGEQMGIGIVYLLYTDTDTCINQFATDVGERT